MVTFTLAILLVACSSSGDSQLPDGVLTPVDCTNLCPAPKKLMDAATRSDAVRLDGDLSAGTGQVLLGWNDGSGAEQWILPAPTEETSITFGAGIDNLPVWNIRIRIPCLPESAANVQLTREGEKAPLTPGTYPLVSVSFDVPDREQSADEESQELSGDVVITSTADGRVSGYMRGWGRGALYSNFTQEDLGVRYEIAAMQLEQISGDFEASP